MLPDDLTEFLRSEAKWAVTRGHAFGEEGSGFARLNIACTRAKLEAALINSQRLSSPCTLVEKCDLSGLGIELVGQLRSQSVARVTFYCSPYHADAPLHPVVEAIRRVLGLGLSSSPSEELARLENWLRDLELGASPGASVESIRLRLHRFDKCY